MGKIRVGINGFGRIGRVVLRVLSERPGVEVVAVNDLSDAATLAHLFQYDSVHRTFQGTVAVEADRIRVNEHWIKVLSEPEPQNLPWGELGVDLVIEATGRFKTSEQAQGHLAAGAKKVIISAPPGDDTVPTVVLGVNDHLVDLEAPIISNASCTTNSAAPMIHLLNGLADIEDVYITTVHSFTTDQKLHDAPHRDLRRARSAPQSIVPTTTGAAKALTKVFPALEGRIGGAGIRVPVPNGSLTDLTCMVKKKVTIEEVNSVFETASQGAFQGILQYINIPLVSVDILGNPHSCVFDSQLTSVLGKMVKIVGWYDNEMGYSNRLADLIERLGPSL
ncbi:MAG: type I glyceraldehyde-3-phosphate dehydrogenase [Salibacteraceae bacterium]